MRLKVRDWNAVVAHFKKSGPMKSKKEILPRKNKHKKNVKDDRDE